MAKVRTLTFTLSRPVAASELDGLPLMAIGVVTDGRSATVERARTIVESLAPRTEATNRRRGRRRQRPGDPHRRADEQRPPVVRAAGGRLQPGRRRHPPVARPA